MTQDCCHSGQGFKDEKAGTGLEMILKALCDGGNRSLAAATFFCLLVLKKQQALHLHQSSPYEDIFATPGPMFYNW
uniref:Rad21/Rec8-like protein C-terminal eukaryotic domain-containing protein n=1 Tax=Seriola lalandi dorsalis TaxID=1841481 RepID=A0A3B4YPC5_SERLL